MSNEYDLANLNTEELEDYSGTLAKTDKVVVVVDGKPYLDTVAHVQDAT